MTEGMTAEYVLETPKKLYEFLKGKFGATGKISKFTDRSKREWVFQDIKFPKAGDRAMDELTCFIGLSPNAPIDEGYEFKLWQRAPDDTTLGISESLSLIYVKSQVKDIVGPVSNLSMLIRAEIFIPGLSNYSSLITVLIAINEFLLQSSEKSLAS